MKLWCALTALALASACGSQENPGGLTDEETQGLNAAAEMLDSAETLPGESDLGNTEELPATGEAASNGQ